MSRIWVTVSETQQGRNFKEAAVPCGGGAHVTQRCRDGIVEGVLPGAGGLRAAWAEGWGWAPVWTRHGDVAAVTGTDVAIRERQTGSAQELRSPQHTLHVHTRWKTTVVSSRNAQLLLRKGENAGAQGLCRLGVLLLSSGQVVISGLWD